MKVIVEDVYDHILREIANSTWNIWSKAGFEVSINDIYESLEEPPLEKFGDIALPTFRFSKKFKVNYKELISKTLRELDLIRLRVISRVNVIGGYINFFINEEYAAKELFQTISNIGYSYGLKTVEKPLRIVVEHTSANPVHPLHIGHGRNAILGDVLSRILTKRGHRVIRRFYINDMGRQVAILAYGCLALGSIQPTGKPDHFYGIIYSATNAVIEIDRLKKELEEARKKGDYVEAEKVNSELLDWLNVLAELKSKNNKLVMTLIEKLKGKDHEREIQNIMRTYEKRLDENIVKTVRRICADVIEGFRETLGKMGVEFDYWDWESDLVWRGIVDEVMARAEKSPYFTTYKGALALDFSTLQKISEIREKLKLPKSFEIPPLILRRSDGTTLYTTRDIAYSIVKFKNADKVINVIMSEQKLAQAQLRLALLALGYRREAYNLIHYSYEIVNLPGVKMSGRKGRFVDLDSLIEEAISRAYFEVSKRNPNMAEEWKEKIARIVGLGAVRYALVSVSASKPLTFIWDNVLNFEKNSGPYIQYTYARAINILKNYGKKVDFDLETLDYNVLRKPIIRRLLILLIKFPKTFTKAADELKPECLVEYAGKLADTFNSFYTTEPVIKEPDEGKKRTKLYIVKTVEIVLKNILTLLGIEAPERM